MSSLRADLAAHPGRGNRTMENISQEYQVLLPTLPTGRTVSNTLFFHADMKARPYRVEDFRDMLIRFGALPDVAALGAFQMNHVWAVTFKNAEALKKMLAAKEVTVKERRCIIVDPSNQDIRLKLHWVLHNVTDDDVRLALAPYGKVTEVARERWRVRGCSEQASTTRSVSLKLKAGLKVEDLPHQLRVAGDNALVAVPGRPPMCLRCRGTGHVRRECRVPRCETCRHFGHDADACVKTYASVTGPAVVDEASEHFMDEADAEEAARAREEEPSAAATRVKDDVKGENGSNKGEDDAKRNDGQTTTLELQPPGLEGAKEQPEGKECGEPRIVQVVCATATEGASPASDLTPPPASDDLQGTPQDVADAEMADANGASGKRVRDDGDEDDDEGSGNTSSGELFTATGVRRRPKLKVRPNVPTERHKSASKPPKK